MVSLDETAWANGLISKIEPTDVAGIISGVSDIAVIINNAGVIDVVLPGPRFADVKSMSGWKGRHLQETLTYESISKFESRLEKFLSGAKNVLPVELNHGASEGFPEFPMRYSFHQVGSHEAILMLGSDLRTTAEMQQQLVAAQIALENDYEAQREHDIRFRILMESSDVPTTFVSVNTGKIAACNSAAELLFGKPRQELIDAAFSLEFESKGRRDLVDRLVTAAMDQPISPVDVTSIAGNRNLTLLPTLFRGASGQMLLCKFKLAEGQEAATDQLQLHMVDLYKNGVDSIVFLNASGDILSANDSFLKLADATHSQIIRGRSMVEFFGRGAVDLNVMLENARRTGSMRLYATKLITELGVDRSVEISTTLLKAGADKVFAMVLRDSRRVDTVRNPVQQITDVDMPSVLELIGGHSLKEIVAKTTDVIEKMCIEAAVQMTSNNRVAAAEMLGLSRQSLYVKLRKYSLINRP